MAAVVSVRESFDLGGNHKMYLFSVAFDASYETGGEAIDLGSNERLESVVVTGGDGGYSFGWDAANQKLLAYYNDYAAVAAGPHIQVPNATNLSALSAVQCVGIGQ